MPEMLWFFRGILVGMAIPMLAVLIYSGLKAWFKSAVQSVIEEETGDSHA